MIVAKGKSSYVSGNVCHMDCSGAGACDDGLYANRVANRKEIQRRVDEASECRGNSRGNFALLGLLIAFTFSNGISRFDDRRKLIVKKANSIGTAFLRIHLLSPEAQPEMRNLFSSYLDSAFGSVPAHTRSQSRKAGT
jgi:hypothetical protein